MLGNITIHQEVQEYLKATLGISVHMRQWDQVNSLPLYLQEAFTLYSTDLLGHECLLAFDQGLSQRTTGQIFTVLRKLTERWGKSVIYIAATLSSVNRYRFVEAKVPFIVPGKQLYLAPLGIDFRKAYEKPSKQPTEILSPIAQLLVLQVLHGHDIEQETPTKLAARLGYTKMTIGRAFNELEALRLAESRKLGKERYIHFTKKGKELWDCALPYLRDPVKRRILVSDLNHTQHALIAAGETALSQYSNINPQSHATYAVHYGSTEAKHLAEHSIDAQEAEGDCTELELWTYDPRLLSTDGAVDRLSLYLSLREEKDERVHQAMEAMLRSMRW
ncbi:MAG: hypothetical protein LWX23_01210 [Spirochaetia bacterium]|nr:hypothetical protein [Spirochaetia bacterium]MCE1208073.1 hypothetical protein [Spirochaetia bacterium]